MEDKAPVKLIVMGNSMKKACDIMNVFDLKGSTVKRIVKEFRSPTTTLKDQNLLQLNREHRQKAWLNFSKKDRDTIMTAMISDVGMLRKFNLMDYSLLLCIQKNPDYDREVKN